MGKGDDVLKKEEFNFLNQMINSLEESEIQLEKAYKNRDFAKFNRLKKSMENINKKISEILR